MSALTPRLYARAGLLPLLLVLAWGQATPTEARAQASEAESMMRDSKTGSQDRGAERRWSRPELAASKNDWILTKSGEWVKGDLIRLRDKKVEFDSDEFDEVSVDFVDIVIFVLPKPHSFRIEGRIVHRGPAEMYEGVIRVTTEDGVVEIPREKLVGIVQGSGGEWERWSFDLGLGVAARSGNTNTADLTGRGDILREGALTRWGLRYTGAISSNEVVDTGEQQTTANNHRVSSAFDFFLTRRLFVTVPFFEYFTDPFQNIQTRITPGGGIGYQVVDRSWLDWELTLGAGYQFTEFVPTLGEPIGNDFALIPATQFNLDLPFGIEWDNGYRLQIIATDIGKTNHHLESLLSIDLFGPIDLDLSFVFDRIEEPTGGVLPDDFRFSVGLGLDM